MKHLRQLSSGARNALAAALIVTALYPAPINLALHYTAAIGLVIAALLILRIHPAGTHKTLTAVRIHPTVASLVSGHTPPAPKPEPTYKHSPTGPQIPVTNHTR